MISCIITTYKREPEILRRAIRSAQSQSYQDIEIIIVNDAPEDTLLEKRIRDMIQNLQDDRIQYLVHDYNQGACAARNTGALAAKGEYLAFLDDDDEWLPEKLEEQLKYMADENVGLVSCESYIVNKRGDKIYSEKPWPAQFNSDLEVLLTGNWLGGVSFPLIRSSCFFEAGQFDIEMKSSQDTDLYIRLVKISKAIICHKPLLNYYITSDSISANIQAKIQGFERILEKYKTEYQKYPDAYRSRLLWLGNGFMYFGEERAALHYFWLAIRNGASIEDVCRYCVRGYQSRRKALKEASI